MSRAYKCDNCGEFYDAWEAYWELNGAEGDAISIDVYAARGTGKEIERNYCKPCLLKAVQEAFEEEK